MANTNQPRSGFATDSSSTLDKDLEKDVENETGLHHFATMHRSSTTRTVRSRKPEDIDGSELVNLPSRTLGDDANMGEYLEETVSGVIPGPKGAVGPGGKIEDYELVTFTVDDPENPKNWSKAFKWSV